MTTSARSQQDGPSEVRRLRRCIQRLRRKLMAAQSKPKATRVSRQLTSVQPGEPAEDHDPHRHEVAQRQRAERAYHDQAKILQSVLDHIGDGVVVVDRQGQFIQFNPQGQRILGIGALNVDSTRWPAEYGLYLPDQRTPFPSDELPLVQAMRGQRVEQAEIFVRHPRLSDTRWLSVTATPLIDEQGQPNGAVAVFRDITHIKRAEEERLAERQTLEYMVNAFDRDRRLTAYELHDGLVQQVTGAMLQLEAARHRLRSEHPPAPHDAAAALEETCGLLRAAIDEARRLIGGLQPPVIDEGGVVAAIEYLVQQYAERGTLTVEFSHDLPAERYPPLVESTVFRIVQESLHNVARHSGASLARVRLARQADTLTVEVRDDGHGFDASTVSHDRFGLRGIRERARLLGGTARFESSPGQGTLVHVTIPLPAAD